MFQKKFVLIATVFVYLIRFVFKNTILKNYNNFVIKEMENA